MILPNVRASFGASDIETLLQLLEQRTRRSRRRWTGQLTEEGIDTLLDHPMTLSAVMENRRVSGLSAKLAFYVMVRHTLLDGGLDNADIADYVAALLVEFTENERAFRITRYDDKTYRYIVDLVSELEGESSERRQFLLRAHLGNYSLWLSGLFPDYVIARVHRRGAPGLDYFEELGSAGFVMASECELADRHDLVDIYREVARGFRVVRRALNRVSDRFFFPTSTSVDRLLRQALDGVGHSTPGRADD